MTTENTRQNPSACDINSVDVEKLNEEIRQEIDKIGFNYDDCESNEDIMEVDTKIATFMMNKARQQGIEIGRKQVIQDLEEMGILRGYNESKEGQGKE